MSDTERTGPASFVDELGYLNVPEAFAKKADARAFEIFEREMRFDQPFRKCLGQIYMVGVQAGIVAARGIKSDE